MIRYLFVLLFAALTACSSLQLTEPELGEGTLFRTWWRVERIEGEKAEFMRGQRRDMHIILYSSKKMVGSGGCNRINGSFKQLPGFIRFGPITSTKMMCQSGVMARDRAFVEALRKSRSYRINGPHLKLYDQSGHEVLRFMAVKQR